MFVPSPVPAALQIQGVMGYRVGSPRPVEEPVCFNSKKFLGLATAVDKKMYTRFALVLLC